MQRDVEVPDTDAVILISFAGWQGLSLPHVKDFISICLFSLSVHCMHNDKKQILILIGSDA